MKYQIEMLNVGPGDCCIIQYFISQDEYRLILIDAGRYDAGKKVLLHLNRYYSGHPINYAIVTHPDNDHFGGFVYLLEKLEKRDTSGGIEYVNIENFIVNDPGTDQEAKDYKHQHSDDRTQSKIRSVFDLDGHRNLLELIDGIKGVKRSDRFAGQYLDDSRKIPIMFIAPTKEYFNSLVPELRHGLKLVKEAELKEISDTKKEWRDIDQQKDDKSSHNASSLIFVFYPNGKNNKTYLFMGDSTRAAYEKIPLKYRIWITNAYWLKVPHHGSIYNLTTRIMRSINPQIAYISAPGNDDHPAEEIIDYLKGIGVDVFTTNHHKDLLHRRGTDKRPGWNKADPI